MKRALLTVLLIFAVSSLWTGNGWATYGKPYGSSDDTEVEQSDVKTIDQLNRATEIEEAQPEQPELEQMRQRILDENENVTDPADEPPAEQTEPPPPEHQEDSAQ